MGGTGIYIATGDRRLLENVRSILSLEGYVINGSSTHASQVLREIRTIKTDLLLLDSTLQGINTLELLDIITDLSIPIILIVDTWEKKFAVATRKMIVRNTIVKPVTAANLLPAVETALTIHYEFLRLKNEVNSLKDELETRKIVEKAKGIIMEKLKLTEREAYKLIRSQSMKQSKSMKEISQAIIISDNIYNKK